MFTTGEEFVENSTISSPYNLFCYYIRNDLTRKYYERRVKKFFDYIKLGINDEIEKRFKTFAESSVSNKDWALSNILSFLQFEKNRVYTGEITAATLRNFLKAIKLLCEASEIQIPWKKIARGLPKAKQFGDDRAPTIGEIKRLIEYPDRRIKPIIYTMCSSGIRIGAWDYLKWKHIIPIEDESRKIIAAKIIVYAGTEEEYYSFISLEAYESIKEWMNFRISFGESISENSYLMRDLWQTTNLRYGAKWGLASNAKKMKSSGIKRIIERALWEQGLRKPLNQGMKRHEWKGAHGFRKFYKTRSEQQMKPINVEITMGHNIGLSASYYKPTEKEVFEDYLNAIDSLTINEENRLRNKVAKLEIEKSRIDELALKIKNLEKRRRN
jgi:hypothetical protein